MGISLRIVAAAVMGSKPACQTEQTEHEKSGQNKSFNDAPLFFFNGIPIFRSDQALEVGSSHNLIPG
ncbi:MAG: hypothetical protein KBC33_02615 [Candidatus Pacebacteria bacterium]|nr:hypothetical protein [Candidatus Paceibacterota bacterium]